ncbi:MAG: DNA (cytosine-5-)-methyltransferase [Candidatus Pacebacteria bacterium]|nr:DNA (cytosine-5-)-methyltransferase [Candidatus Paceibacterota bacterium]
MKVVSLFSGCGGSDLGLIGGFTFLNKRYKKLSFDVVFAIDNDSKAAETYNNNFKIPCTIADIVQYNIKNIPNADLIVGGFPCQSFSTVNPTKNPHDKRGKLYIKMANILKQKQPKFFIAENVKGMLVLQKGKIYKAIERKFSKQGYIVKHQLIHAADFGIPQKRERVFMVGVRKDIPLDFKFPKPTHSEKGVGKKNWISLGKVIDELELEDDKYYFSKRAVNGMKRAKNNMKRGLAQDLSKPCLTITSHLAKVSINSRDPVLLVNEKKELYRRFTPKEAARIQSFPDKFIFPVSETQAYKQIGNAIAPVLMWHVAQALMKQIKKCDRHLCIF